MKPVLTIHKAGNGYIGRLVVTDQFLEDNEKKSTQCNKAIDVQTIFILDRSGSMGQNVDRMASIVIPAVARQYFSLSSRDKYTLITFDSVTQTKVATVKQFENSKIQNRGATRMAPIFCHLMDALDPSVPNVRIVAVSDGLIHDQNETLEAAEKASRELKDTMSISVTAIRLFTSSAQPDTRALASILQLNTATVGSIVDVKASDTVQGLKNIVDTIGIAAGNPGPVFKLEGALPCFQQVPWGKAYPEIYVKDIGANKSKTFWLSFAPGVVTLNGEPVEILHGDPVTHETINILLEDRIKYFLDQLHVLKVLNSANAKKELNRIVEYFQELEASFPPPEDLANLLNDGSLTGRSKYIKASISRRLKSVALTMQNIANDERVATLNLAQQADYLRQAGNDSISRNAKALARRAGDSGIDFDGTLRAEILTMAAHISELDQVDDSQHAVSFYSSATTLEGIRYVVELANDQEVLCSLTAADMLRLFNVVGIASVAPVGDFPDPMTYRIEKLLYGTYVSVADITMALHQGGNLTAPGHSEQIVTAVPFFEDLTVQKFLQRYARTSLEYIASIGMRRMICEVPKTYPYTVCAGIWKMVEELDRQGKTEIRVRNFQHLVLTYENAVEGYFDHILPLLDEDNDLNKTMSFDLGYNGITNMIAPILCKVRNQEPLDMPRILRALYSFETYQVMRRVTRGGHNGPNARQEALDKMLGIDFDSDRATSLPAMFSQSQPVHCKDARVDQPALNEYAKHLWFVPYATLLEPLFTALLHPCNRDKDPIRAIRAIEPMSDETITKALNLSPSVSLEDFILYNVVEGLLCTSKAHRVDKETNLPKLGDLGIPGVGQKMVEDYVASRYEADYKQRLKRQSEKEQSILQKELVATMVSTKRLGDFVACIENGLQRGHVSIRIDSPNCAGFQTLHKALMDAGNTVPLRAAKLYVVYSGRLLHEPEQKVFNGGNLYFCDWKPLRALLETRSRFKVWE